MAETKLIVGLGNPGREYTKTRHNLGFMVVERLAALYGADFTKCRYADARVADVREGGQRIILALPQTYMNNSGLAVSGIARFDNVEVPGQVMVVCDDIRLEFGQIRLRLSGSDGGHNGLKSVKAHLGSDGFPRLRVGVGAPASPERQADHVLTEFSASEKKQLGSLIEDAAGCLRMWISGETAEAMTRYNKRKDNG